MSEIVLWATISLVVVSFVSNLLMLAGPLFMLQIYDRVLTSQSLPTLAGLVVVITAVYAFYALIETVRSRIALRLANVVDQNFGASLFEASVRLRVVQGATRPLDPVRDGDSLRNFLGSPAPLALLDLPWVPIYLGVVFVVHPLLGWLAVAGGVVIALLLVVSEFWLRKPTSDTTAAIAARQQQGEDARLNAETILAMGMMRDLGERWLSTSAQMFKAQREAGDRAMLMTAVTRATRLLLQSLVLGLGAYVVIAGEMTGGLMIAASVVTARALAPVEQAIANWRQFSAARQGWGRVKGYLNATDKVQRVRETQLPLPNDTLSIKGLAAAPPGAARALITGVSFELSAGDGLGVLGLSGSGKSSLVRALCGVWTPAGGEIRFDGALFQHYEPRQIGRIIGYLPQRADLFEGTVADNIARFSTDATSEKVIAAARMAGTHEVISNLANGYDTKVSANGENLSAGQRQRIGLARALYGDPFVVLLDEPNANLDADGDAALTQAIRAVRARGGIVIVVAHRPSAIVATDKLLFLADGRQMTFGAKQDVLRQITGEQAQPARARL